MGLTSIGIGTLIPAASISKSLLNSTLSRPTPNSLKSSVLASISSVDLPNPARRSTSDPSLPV